MSKRRKVYREGDRLNIYLPKGIDPNFLKWLNNRANASKESLEILMMFFNGELQEKGTAMVDGLLEKLALLSSMSTNEIKALNVTSRPHLNSERTNEIDNELQKKENQHDISYSIESQINESETIQNNNINENEESTVSDNKINAHNDTNNVDINKNRKAKKFSGGLNLNKGFKPKNFKNTGLNDLDKSNSGNSIFRNRK